MIVQFILLGSDDRSFNEYPENIVQSIKDCQVLVSSFPIYHAPTEYVREFVVNSLNLTLEKLKQKDNDWFRSQFELIGCSETYLEKQMERVTKAQNVNLDITQRSWQHHLPNRILPMIMAHMRLYKVSDTNTHPLIIMNLLGNELDMKGKKSFRSFRIESELAMEQDKNHSYIKLDETAIIAASITHTLINDLHLFNECGANAYIQKIQMFCKRLEIGYSNDKESENDRLQQPGLYMDGFTQEKDLNHHVIVTLQSTHVAKNLAWQAPILKALLQNKSTAIVIPKDNLDFKCDDDRETGMFSFLKSKGYTLELVNT